MNFCNEYAFGSYELYIYRRKNRRRTGLLPSNKTYVKRKSVHSAILTGFTKDSMGRKIYPPTGIASSKGIERKWDSNSTSKAY